MSNFQLQAETAFGGYDNNFGGTSLKEISDLAIYSIGLPQDDAPVLSSIKALLGVNWPKPNCTASSDDGQYRLLGLQTEQVLALVFAENTAEGQAVLLPTIDSSAFITDQSDSWAALEISGADCVPALERLCPLDLHESVFAIGNVSRTIMEHLSVVILRESRERFLLLSPRSSAQSFLHAIEVSLRNVID